MLYFSVVAFLTIYFKHNNIVEKNMFKKKIAAACMAIVLGLLAMPSLAEKDSLLVHDETGSDPRDFRDKFSPYYRYTELENGLEAETLAVFGMFPFSKTFAMTYEIPFVSVDASASASQSDFDLPFDSGGSPIGSNFEATGIGDMNLRFFAPIGRAAGMTWLGGLELIRSKKTMRIFHGFLVSALICWAGLSFGAGGKVTDPVGIAPDRYA